MARTPSCLIRHDLGMATGTPDNLRPRSRSLLLAAVVGLLPLGPIVVGLLIASASVKAGSANPNGFQPVASIDAGASAAAEAKSAQSRTSGPSNRSGATPEALPAGRGALVAFVRHATVIRSSPGGRPVHRLGTHTEFNSPEVLWVAAPRGRWLGVVSPLTGNARLGWVSRGAVSLQRLDWQIKVSLSARRVTVFHGGQVIKRYTVAVGRPEAPTPTGRFAVTDRLATNNPTGPYGCCIIALSALSPHAIQNWSGGDRIAIHSTPETATIGQPVSHGCLRLTLAEGRWLMNHIPLGTPTLISA